MQELTLSQIANYILGKKCKEEEPSAKAQDIAFGQLPPESFHLRPILNLGQGSCGLETAFFIHYKPP